MRIADKTKFLFIVTSQNNVEDRFFFDVAYFVEKLNGKATDIVIVTNADVHSICSKRPILNSATFIDPSEALTTIAACDSENLFIITNCHGGLVSGIDCPTPLKPLAFFDAVKSSSATNVVVVFCQCYAGIYSHTDINSDAKSIVSIGATGLRPSISTSRITTVSWRANISLIAMANWLSKPIDIDGDGLYSIVDMYMYMAAFTNDVTLEIEKSQNTSIIESWAKYHVAGVIAPTLAGSLYKAALKAHSNYLIPHQSTWMNNNIDPACLVFEDL